MWYYDYAKLIKYANEFFIYGMIMPFFENARI